ncbi:MAG: hypothetical protein H0V89_09350 [Deltaproteobacteria bacterium]|nr:hypothetical protein [Deltaproteobacteria bacterium]
MLPWLSLAALAHGPPASVTGVGSADVDGPVHVLLTEGLAVRADEGWRYVCPARWGGSPLSPFAAGNTEEILVPGADDVYRVDRDGGVTPAGDPGHAVGGLLDLDGTNGVWTIYAVGDEREITRLDLAHSFVFSGLRWSGVIGRGRSAELVAAVDGALVSGTLSELGALATSIAGTRLVGTSPQLVPDGEKTWIVDRASGYVGVLTAGEERLVAEGAASVSGPVTALGTTWLALDGVLHTLSKAGPAPTGESTPIGCLVGAAGALWACATDLRVVTPEGALGETVVDLAALVPPDLGDLSDDDGVACWGEWRTFALDLGLDPGEAPAAPETPSDPGPIIAEGSCSSTGRSTIGPRTLCALFVGLVAFRLTTRRRAWHRRGVAGRAGPSASLRRPHESNGRTRRSAEGPCTRIGAESKLHKCLIDSFHRRRRMRWNRALAARGHVWDTEPGFAASANAEK